MNFMITSRLWAKATAISCLLVGSAAADILLIEDQAGFGSLAADLRAAGYTVSVRSHEFANNYANLLNQNFLDDFSLIVYGERGNGNGANLPANVGASLETYLQAGGNLLVTGWDALYRDAGQVTANLVRATAPSGTGVGGNSTWNVVANHPITNGPFGNFTGQIFTSTSYDISVTPNTTAGAIEVVSTGNPRVTGKIIFTNLPGAAGSVGYWNGGSDGQVTIAQPEFVNGGIPQAVFYNYVAMIEGGATPFNGQMAGADIRVGDTDGDGFVTQVLDASAASQAIGDIVSWSWSWPGGSATGEKPELILPANNTPLTVTLTVMDGAGVSYFDSVDVTVFTKTAGLFTDFADSRFTGIVPTPELVGMNATLAGDTLVIDPVEPANEITPRLPSVFRRVAGVWAPSPFTESVVNLRAINDTTLVSGNFATGSNFKVHRLISGQWNSSPLNLSAPPPIASRYDYAFDPGTVVFADLFNPFHASSGGRVFAYDWTGDNWNHTELLPAGGITTNSRWGEEIAVNGDLVAVIRRGTTAVGKSLSIYRKSGATWNLEATIEPNPAHPTYPDNFSGALSIGNGVVVTAVEQPLAGDIIVHEKIGASWQQSAYSLEAQAADFNKVLGVDVDDDGLSFVAKDSLANFLLYQRDPGAASWSAAIVDSPRRLPLADLNPDPRFTGIHFSGGEIVVSDPINGRVRIFNKNVPFDTVNASPVADAGEDIATTSFDGQSVEISLNGLASTDANYEDYLVAEWTWAGGGSASGLFTSAMIHPSVTSVELKITDSRGAVSRDTVMLNIKAPPVVDPGDDVIVVDSDGDGIIRVNVNATLNSSNYPVNSWSWAWPGGVYSGQSGTLTFGEAANGQPVTLTALGTNGLSSQTSFSFNMLSSNPAPVILQPSGGGPSDGYGTAAAIQNGVALIGAPNKRTAGTVTGASYLARNLNGLWPQNQLAPGTRQGDATLVDGDFAFVGSKGFGGFPFFDRGRVLIYKNSPSGWQPFQTLALPPGATTFGSSLAKSGNRLLVGAPQTFNGQSGAGAAYLYEFDGTAWNEVQRFDPPTTVSQGRFGTRVAIAGDVIAISQPSFSTASSVVTFEKVGNDWNFESEFFSNTPSPPLGNEQYHFGQGLGLSASELLIGSPVEGVVYRRTRSAGNWGAATLIDPNRYFFGSSIAMRDNVAVVGSLLENNGLGGAIPGSVTSLLLTGGSWVESGYLKLTPTIDPHISETPNYSTAVSFDGKDLIVGAPAARNSSGVQSGKAYIYRNFAGLNANANFEPRANAGPDILVNDIVERGPAPAYLITEPLGSESVTLNASASTDQENGITSYAWSWPGGSASGVTANVRFPVGTTLVTLTVTDNKGIVNSDTMTVAVSLTQSTPAAVPVTNTNTLTLDLPSPDAKWRLSSEFIWHGDLEPATGIVSGATYQIEIIAFPGSTEIITTYITTTGPNTTEVIELELVEAENNTSTVSFPETSQGYAWRLIGENSWRNVTDDGDPLAENILFTLPIGEHLIEFKPVAGFTTPPSRAITITTDETLALDWSEYLRINSFDPAKTFDLASSPNLAADPYQYVGMIRSKLGRGTGTVVAERVVLTAAHLLFDANGLQWADSQWFSRQQQETRQAPPLVPRGVLYQTSYAKLIAPDSVPGTVANLPEDPQEVDFAVLYFSNETAWNQGSANFLQSTAEKNWLTGNENKHAVGYPQRSQQFEDRGKIFQKQFSSPLTSLGTGLYETTEVFGDGGASGSALFVQPAGTTQRYPAAILLAGQGRAVYRVINQDITRMIKDGEDAATGNDDVLNGDFSQTTIGGLGALSTIGVQVFPAGIRTKARWTITPAKGTTTSNLRHDDTIAFPSSWANFTITFSAISGYKTPAPRKVFNGAVDPGANVYQFTYTLLPPPIVPPTPFQAWQQTHSITDLMSDNDRDGMVALLEYALDRNPGSPDYRSGIFPSPNPSQSVFAEFEVYVSASASGITYIVKASNTPDLTGPTTTLATFTSANGSSNYRKVTDTQPISASTKRFAWLEVVSP